MIRVTRIVRQNLVFIVVAFGKKRRKTKTASKVNTLLSSEYCSVLMQSILILRFEYMLSYGASKLTASCVLLSMSTISSSNFEYK